MPRKKTTKKKTSAKAKKKSVKRATPKKRAAKKVSVSKPKTRRAPVDLNRKRKINVVLKNLLLFGILFVLFVVIASASANQLIDQLFWILAILTAFVAVAFLIILLIFVFMGRAKK